MRTFPLCSALVLSILALACSQEEPNLETGLRPIIGGTSDSGHPAVGALVGNALCTGTLITPKLVLTAAHCFQGYNFDYFKLGPNIDYPTQSIGLKNCYKNPSYGNQTIGGVSQPVHDVAVCVLNQSVSGITPAKLRSASMANTEGTAITFVGYGATSGSGSGKGGKLKVQVNVDSVSPQGFWNLVSGSPVKNTCIGDSGGPGFVMNGGTEEVAGVVSAGDYYCEENGWNMRVDMELAWIKSMVDQHDPGAINFGTCPDGTCAGGETSQTCPSDCGETSTDLWKPCSTAYDCDQEYVCAMFSFGDFCTLECPQPGGPSTCPSPYVCSPVSGGGGVCTPGSGTKCGNGTCDLGESGTTCAVDCNAKLWDQCPNVNLCGPGLFCIAWTDGTNRCTQDCPTANATTGCPSGFICHPLEGESGGACAKDDNAQNLCGNGVCDAQEDNILCPADCTGGACNAIGPVGCCDGQVRIWCEFGAIQKQGCGTLGCGWEAALGRYSCGVSGTADPSSDHPLSCSDVSTGFCGNGACEPTETAAACPQDCAASGPTCGDGICVNVEGCEKCPQDCGVCSDVTQQPEVVEQDEDPISGEETSGNSGGCSQVTAASPGYEKVLLFMFFILLCGLCRHLKFVR